MKSADHCVQTKGSSRRPGHVPGSPSTSYTTTTIHSFLSRDSICGTAVQENRPLRISTPVAFAHPRIGSACVRFALKALAHGLHEGCVSTGMHSIAQLRTRAQVRRRRCATRAASRRPRIAFSPVEPPVSLFGPSSVASKSKRQP
eukprot:6172505-Pleurochrysis_carterae.AAC.1